MTSIDPTSRMLAQLRQTAQEWRRQHPSAAGGAPAGGAARGEKRRDPMHVAVGQVAQIDPEDPDARSKAFRAYLAAVLTQELGPRAAQDPGFAGLVERVSETMASDPQLKDAIDRAGELLLKTARGGA